MNPEEAHVHERARTGAVFCCPGESGRTHSAYVHTLWRRSAGTKRPPGKVHATPRYLQPFYEDRSAWRLGPEDLVGLGVGSCSLTQDGSRVVAAVVIGAGESPLEGECRRGELCPVFVEGQRQEGRCEELTRLLNEHVLSHFRVGGGGRYRVVVEIISDGGGVNALACQAAVLALLDARVPVTSPEWGLAPVVAAAPRLPVVVAAAGIGAEFVLGPNLTEERGGAWTALGVCTVDTANPSAVRLAALCASGNQIPPGAFSSVAAAMVKSADFQGVLVAYEGSRKVSSMAPAASDAGKAAGHNGGEATPPEDVDAAEPANPQTTFVMEISDSDDSDGEEG